MNQFFNFNRFNLLVLKHWADNKSRYGLSVLAFMGMLILWFSFMLLAEVDSPMDWEIQLGSYFVLLFAGGAFYASQYFQELGSRTKGSNFLMVPASTFEKLLCSLLYNVVLFLVVFTAAFYLIDMLMVTIVNSFFAIGEGTKKPEVISIFKIIGQEFVEGSSVYFLSIFFSVQAAFLLGSIYFEKYNFVKTIICGFIGFFIIFCLIYFFYDEFLPKGDFSKVFPTSYIVHVDGVNDHLVKVPSWLDQLSRILVVYGIAPFLWMVTYYRLREKQV